MAKKLIEAENISKYYRLGVLGFTIVEGGSETLVGW